jgi:3-phytase
MPSISTASDQQANAFNVYPREGRPGQPHVQPLIARVPASTIESDGSDATSVDLGPRFPKGVLVADQ